MEQTLDLGKFFCSGKMRITDPCYDLKSTPYGGFTQDVKPGWWYASVIRTDNTGGWGTRNKEIEIVHSSFNEYEMSDIYLHTFDAGVDSGQCGFFDYDHFAENGEKENWYKEVCEITLHDKDAGIVNEKGAVSESGYGDGCYPVYRSYDNEGNVVRMKIVFFDESWENDEEDEW